MATMIGAAIIVFALLVFIPVSVLMSGSLGAAAIGFFLRNEADVKHEGSELIDLNG